MKDYSGVWILGEQRNGKVQTIAHELLNRGRSLADKRRVPLTAIILGKAEPEDLDMLIKRGADQVIAIEADELATFLPEPYTNAMAYLVDKYKPEIIIAGATSTGRTLMPLLAIRFHAGLTADCTGLDIEEETGNLLQTRPAIGGNIMATIKSPSHRPQMATVRPKSTRPAAFNAARTGKIIREEVDPSLLGSRVKLLKFTKSAEETANIQEADVIIAGGRGLKKGDNFQLINELAVLLDGAVGASRDAVDRGWISYPHQVGLSGKTVSPKLYLCAGISGSIQHLAGIKTAENIVAINTNPEAQIFQVANYGIVADLFEIIPILIEKIKAKKAGQGTDTRSAS